MLLVQKFNSLKSRVFLLYMYFNEVADKTLLCFPHSLLSLNIHEEENETSILFSCFYFKQQVKLGSPDYVDCSNDEATEDFMKRIECYKNSYETLDETLDK